MLSVISNELIQRDIIKEPLFESTSVSGGNINNCFKVSNSKMDFFVKVNNNQAFPKMFEKEVKGLALLANSESIAIPKVILQFEEADFSFLILEWIVSNSSDGNWLDFGNRLANLHQQTNDYFGLDHDNYIGSLVQTNSFKNNWHTFFLECRLIPQLELGISNGWANRKHFKEAENITKVVEQEFPKEQPSLLHGDLWSGNFIFGKNQTYLIDPAVFYGNREMEIAFTKLFGGFQEEFYEGYQNVYPIQPDFNKRVEILQLYYLLVHANLFGGNYVADCIRILKRF